MLWNYYRERVNVAIRPRIGNLKNTHVGDHWSVHTSEGPYIGVPMYGYTRYWNASYPYIGGWSIHRSFDISSGYAHCAMKLISCLFREWQFFLIFGLWWSLLIYFLTQQNIEIHRNRSEQLQDKKKSHVKLTKDIK